ncbi:MAG: tetratricopeptide repeat protein [Deltaproteobacteria bacterium]|nr:tetratricopeptide repeat protein [Deltaproteobacteria bacterium]
MDSSIIFLRRELERLFEQEAMVRLSADLLGIDLKDVGPTKGKGALARLLVDRCAAQNALQALSDAILFSSSDADSRLRELSYNGYGNDVQPGAQVGSTRVLRKIGEGGVGTVYLAEMSEQEGIESTRVALKVFRPEVSLDRSAVNRYKTAARIMQSIRSSGVASVYGVGQLEDGRPWVAEEYIAGQTLAERIKQKGSIRLREAKPLFRNILEALQALHERGLVHGNLKTENVFIIEGADSSDKRTGAVAVLVDGCINRLALPSKIDARTSGLYSVLGTARSLAPEQARGVDFDLRSDIYAMGILMYEVLTGRPPFEADSAIDVIARHLSFPIERPSLRSRQGWIPKEIDDLVGKALAKNPKDRFQNSIEMLAALDRVSDPSKKVVILDLEAFEQLVSALRANPSDERTSDLIEQQAREAEQAQEAVSIFEEISERADDGITKLALLLRAARIIETDLRDDQRAQAAYRRVLELDPDNQSAREGLELSLRHSGDFDGLLDVLLDKVERAPDSGQRVKILREIATIYEKNRRDPANAFTAWVQALAEQPRDEDIVRQVERLAAPSSERWPEALETLAAMAQQIIAQLYPDETAERERVERKMAELQMRLDEARRERADAEQKLEVEAQKLTYIKAQYDQAVRNAEELTRLADQYSDQARSAHDVSERSIDAFENAGRQRGDRATFEQRRTEVERLGKEAERAVAAADEAERQARGTADEASAAWERAQELEIDVTEANDLYNAAAATVRAVHTAEEYAAQAVMDAAEGKLDEFELSEQRERQTQELLQISVLMGRWYSEKLHRPEQALPCFTQALSVDPVYEPAFDGAVEVYRSAQSWNELAQVLLQFAEQTKNPIKARDCRAEAADILARNLNDQQTALRYYQMVLDQDPSHQAAYRSMRQILIERHDWQALVDLLEKRLGFLEGDDYLESLSEAAEIYEHRLAKSQEATRKYEAILEVDPKNLTALKGLERLYAQQNDFERLLANLQSQLDVVSTPKQTILLLERIGLIQEEEFVDHAEAAASFEQIVAIDPAHEGANAALARLYRVLERYEDMVETLDRHARSTQDERQKIALYLQSVRVLMNELRAPDRAMVVCERALAIDEQQSEALELLARLRSEVGDVPAAIEALEALAEREADKKRQAELYTRAARLLEDNGDSDAAVTRYKKALDCDNTTIDAAAALRRIYSERGDYHATVEMLRKELNTVTGDLERAKLLAELGSVFYRYLNELDQAYLAFQQALELDRTCTEAIIGLGEIAYDGGNFNEATQFFELILNRVDTLEAGDASKLCLVAGECFLKTGDSERARDVFKRARELARDDLEINEKLALLVMELGDASEAERLYDRILRKFAEDIPGAKKLELTLALGEAQLSANHAKRAVDTFRAAYELSPDNPQVLEALSRAYEVANEWQEMISILQLRSRLSSDKEEAYKLLVQIGDVFLEKLQDRRAAVQAYSAALEIDPNNRNLLSKLMAVYSDTKDWPRLIEIVLRIASMVDDKTQLAKYQRTVAAIAHHELGRYDEAANYYEKSLVNEPQNEVAFTGLIECLTQNQDWERLVSAYQNQILAKTESAPNEEIAALLDACGEILQHRIGRLEEAIQVYEQAQAFDPENHSRKEKLNEIYTKEPKRFFKQSIQINRDMLQTDPRRVDSYKAMRKTYTKVKRPDESWCVCQVLHYLNMCDPDEEKFFQKYRLQQLPRIKVPISEEMWLDFVIHPTQPANLTAIFAVITPAVIMSQSQALSTFGVNPEYRTDPETDATVIGRMLDYVSKSAMIALPNVYHRTDDAGGLSFLFSSPPAIGIGEGARAGGPQQALAFVAARHLSYFRSGHYLRQMVPTGTGLRAWLLAAIRTVSPKFPVPPNLQSQVQEYGSALERHLVGPQRDVLRSMARNLLETAPELDMKRWITGVDLTADRIGFILANDLKLANAVIDASPEDTSAIPQKERINELMRFCVSDEYFELRRQLGIALGQ